MLNLSLFLFTFSISMFIGFFINKYTPSYYLHSLYYYLSFINIKYILYFNLILNIFIILINQLNYNDISNLILQMADSTNMTDNSSNLDPSIIKTEVKDNTIPISNTNDVAVDKVTINDPNFSLNLATETVEKAITSLTLTAGAKLGLEVMKNSPHIGAKAVGAITGALALTQAKESISKYYSQKNNSNNDLSSKYISDISENTVSNTPNFNEYPLNLIDDLIVYNYCSFIFLGLIISSLLALYLKDINIDKYLPLESPNKSIQILRKIYNRFMKIWLQSSKFMIIFSSIFLIFCLIMSKFCLFLIKN